MKTTIEYSVNGDAISDFYVQDYVREISNNIGKNYNFSTENIFTAIRLAIAQGIIDHNDIVFKFGKELIHINKFGAVENRPKGFCDQYFELHEAIVRTVSKLKIEEENVECRYVAIKK